MDPGRLSPFLFFPRLPLDATLYTIVLQYAFVDARNVNFYRVLRQNLWVRTPIESDTADSRREDVVVDVSRRSTEELEMIPLLSFPCLVVNQLG